jgi:hypothetical protein
VHDVCFGLGYLLSGVVGIVHEIHSSRSSFHHACGLQPFVGFDLDGAEQQFDDDGKLRNGDGLIEAHATDIIGMREEF